MRENKYIAFKFINMTKLESNLYSLVFLATRLKLSVKSLQNVIQNKGYIDEVKFSQDFYKSIGFANSIGAVISEYTIVQFCSFLDEYKNFNPRNHQEEHSSRIIKVRIKNKYGLQRIQQWKDLYRYRNQIAAHNLNIKNTPILETHELIKYNIPDTIEEKILFQNIVVKMCNNIFEEFSEIRDSFDYSFNLGKKLEVISNVEFDLERELELVEENM